MSSWHLWNQHIYIYSQIASSPQVGLKKKKYLNPPPRLPKLPSESQKWSIKNGYKRPGRSPVVVFQVQREFFPRPNLENPRELVQGGPGPGSSYNWVEITPITRVK